MNTTLLTEDINGHIEGHLVPNDKTQGVFKTIYDKIQPKRILEIGFNAGHSAYMVLEMLPEVTYRSVDICFWGYTYPNAQKLEEMYGNRFAFMKADSKRLIASTLKNFDAIFIDGDHSVNGLSSDLRLANDAEIPWILVDDYDPKWFPAVPDVTEHMMGKDEFPYELVEVYTYESRDGDNMVALLKRHDVD